MSEGVLFGMFKTFVGGRDSGVVLDGAPRSSFVTVIMPTKVAVVIQIPKVRHTSSLHKRSIQFHKNHSKSKIAKMSDRLPLHPFYGVTTHTLPHLNLVVSVRSSLLSFKMHYVGFHALRSGKA